MKLFCKHHCYFLFIHIFLTTTLAAQRVTVDSLQHTLSNKKAPFQNVKNTLALAEAYLTVNTDSAFIYSNNAIAFAKKLNNKSLEADGYIILGEANDYVNQQTIGLEYFLQARNIYEEVKSDSGVAVTYYAIGEMYNTLKETKTAKNYLQKSLTLFLALKDEESINSLYGSLGNIYFKESNYDSAQYYNNLELVEGRKQHDTDLLLDALSNIADVLIAQNRLEEAMPYLLEANKYADETGSYYGIAYGKNQLAKISIAKKEYAQALQLADDIIVLGRKLNMDDLIMEAVELKYKTYKLMQQPDSALLYIEQYNAMADTLTGKRKYLSLDSLLNVYRFGKKQREVELLKQTNKSNAILIVAFCGALVLTGWLLLSFYRRSIDRRKMNAALQEQSLKLQNINQLKDRMFSIISHDLRGPVASLKSLTDFMKSHSLSNEESEMVVKELRQSVNGVDMLLENLLVWAKMQINGDIVSKPEPLKIQLLVEESVQLYQKSAAQKNIAIECKIEEDATAVADRNYLSLIIRNLINNAIKFTHTNGTILIEVITKGKQIQICVADNGIGMSKQEIENLFNLEKPFTKRGTMNEKGSGLGLLFVKEYTERCGGCFSITSEKDKGSKFCITLSKTNEQ